MRCRFDRWAESRCGCCRPRARLDPAALVAASEAARQAEFDRMVGEEVARLDKREMRRQARRTAIIERHAGSG